MKIVVDMNLSPSWIPLLERAGCEAVHWSEVGDPRAIDVTVMEWARQRGYVLFTHDLGFGAILASTRATGPSVVQVRAQDVTPDYLGQIVIDSLHEYEDILLAGAIISIDETRARTRILPLT